MAYVDGETGLEIVAAGELERASACPASWGTPASEDDPTTSPNLARWIAVRDAIEFWHESSSDTAANDAVGFAMSHLDPVQRDVCEGMFRTYQRLANRDDPIDFQVVASEISDPASEMVLRSRPTAVVRRPGQMPEFIKLRTGRRST